MNKKQEAFIQSLYTRGLVDQRKLCAAGNAKRLPNGEYGFVLMCLKGHHLDFYDTDFFSQSAGDLLYSVDLRDITDLKTSTFLFNCYIKFTYRGFRFKIDDAFAKDLYAAVKAEATQTV